MAISATVLEKMQTTEEVLAQRLQGDVKEIFSSMVEMDNLLNLPVQTDPTSHFYDCVSAMVGFVGTYNGLVSLHAPSTLAKRVTANMLGMEIEEVNDDVLDAMGEIANMLAGAFKMHISRGGTDTHLSIPSVINGKEYMISVLNNPETLTLRFSSDDYWFLVSVAMESL